MRVDAELIQLICVIFSVGEGLVFQDLGLDLEYASSWAVGVRPRIPDVEPLAATARFASQVTNRLYRNLWERPGIMHRVVGFDRPVSERPKYHVERVIFVRTRTTRRRAHGPHLTRGAYRPNPRTDQPRS